MNKFNPAFLTDICRVIFKNGDLCKTLFSDYGDKDFLRQIVYLAHDKTISEWWSAGMKESDETFELLYTLSVNGSVAVIQRWIQDGMKRTPEEVALFIEKVSYSGLKAFQ